MRRVEIYLRRDASLEPDPAPDEPPDSDLPIEPSQNTPQDVPGEDPDSAAEPQPLAPEITRGLELIAEAFAGADLEAQARIATALLTRILQGDLAAQRRGVEALVTVLESAPAELEGWMYLGTFDGERWEAQQLEIGKTLPQEESVYSVVQDTNLRADKPSFPLYRLSEEIAVVKKGDEVRIVKLEPKVGKNRVWARVRVAPTTVEQPPADGRITQALSLIDQALSGLPTEQLARSAVEVLRQILEGDVAGALQGARALERLIPAGEFEAMTAEE